ncbi:hypothetical protein SLUN_38915 (plasmid) [Streptomyces lunaelactis]|uniref:Uncharacterized protein n=1 Tax=Streptomyces lunaelactis TaxID=1535768 RepID=A0A2R4TFX5_9ACTN|nr:hypothetical protein [Streptomyces lunaelactis]AVZ78003.1 hypothetical protein SLUN_38915 [Streptomyces lunaelactis]NUK84921.1 hypothetical protein [Streptomyces lunaelactis]
MLTPMAKDYAKHHETKRAAEKLLTERYGDENDARYGGSLPPEKAITSVLVALSDYLPPGQEPQEVPAEDVLAALSHVDDARQRLDNQELRLIRAARTRGASWQKVADALGLGTRQSAETRALRLERGAQTYRGRDVASQRLDKARDRAAETWCEEHVDRVREVAEQLYDTSGAWDLQSLDHAGTRGTLHAIGELLATDASPVKLVSLLSNVRYRLAPYSGEAPKPTGKQAADATKALAALVELLAEQAAARTQVTSARGEATS